MKKQAVLSLSGGMDSSTVLLHLLAHDYKVTAVGFDYGSVLYNVNKFRKINGFSPISEQYREIIN